MVGGQDAFDCNQKGFSFEVQDVVLGAANFEIGKIKIAGRNHSTFLPAILDL